MFLVGLSLSPIHPMSAVGSGALTTGAEENTLFIYSVLYKNASKIALGSFSHRELVLLIPTCL